VAGPAVKTLYHERPQKPTPIRAVEQQVESEHTDFVRIVRDGSRVKTHFLSDPRSMNSPPLQVIIARSNFSSTVLAVTWT
jgi:hypothetical protein